MGFQDVNLVLREALKTYMSDLDCNKALKKRWLRYRQICDAGNNIQTEEKQLDQVSLISRQTKIERSIAARSGNRSTKFQRVELRAAAEVSE